MPHLRMISAISGVVDRVMITSPSHSPQRSRRRSQQFTQIELHRPGRILHQIAADPLEHAAPNDRSPFPRSAARADAWHWPGARRRFGVLHAEPPNLEGRKTGPGAKNNLPLPRKGLNPCCVRLFKCNLRESPLRADKLAIRGRSPSECYVEYFSGKVRRFSLARGPRVVTMKGCLDDATSLIPLAMPPTRRGPQPSGESLMTFPIPPIKSVQRIKSVSCFVAGCLTLLVVPPAAGTEVTGTQVEGTEV